MSKLADIVVSLTLDNTEFLRSINEAGDSIRGVSKNFERSGSNMSKSMDRAFREMADDLKMTQNEFKRLGGYGRWFGHLTEQQFNDLPDHVKPFAKEMRSLQKAFRESSTVAVGSMDEIRKSIIKTQTSAGKMNSISDSGREAVKTMNDLKKASREAQLAILGFSADGKKLINADQATASMERFKKQIDETVDELERLRQQGDLGSYVQGMRNLEHEAKLVNEALKSAAGGGQSLYSALARLGIVTTSMGNEMALAMEQFKDEIIMANKHFMEMDTQAQKITKALKSMNAQKLDQQFLKLGHRLEMAARQGSALNLALKQLGKNAPMKDIMDRVALINSGLMRMQSLQMGMGIAVAATTYGLILLSNHVDGRLIPAFEDFKKTWTDALKPFVQTFTTAAVAVLNFATKIGEMAKQFAQAHPQLAKVIGGFLYLTMVFTLLLSPLAIAIGLTDGLSAAFAMLWGIIQPFVLGFLTVVGTAMLLAAAVVGVTAAIYNMWNASEQFRKSWTNLVNSLSSAISTAFAPLQQKWEELKGAFATLVSTLSGGQVTSITSFWTTLGNTVGNVINNITQALLPVFQSVFSAVAAAIGAAINGLIIAFNWLAAFWKVNGDTIMGVVQSIWSVVSTAFGAVYNFILSIMPSIVSTVKAGWDLIKAAIDFTMKYIAPVVSTAFSFIWSIIQAIMPIIVGVIVSTWNNIKAIITSTINIIKNVIQLFTNILKGNWKGAWDNVKAILQNAVTLIWNLIQLYFVGKMLAPFKSFGSAAKGLVKGTWSAIKSIITSLLSGTKNFIVNVWGAVKSALGGHFSGILKLGSSTFKGLKSTVTSIFNSIKSTATSVWNRIKNAIIDPIQTAKSKVLNIIGTIVSAFRGMKIHIPAPHLPKISVEWVTVGKGKVSVKIPKFHLNATGNIFNGASLLGGNNIVGEAGAEVVMPIEHKRYMKPYASMVAGLLPKYMKQENAGGNQYHINFNQPVVIREEADIQKLADEIEKRQRVAERAKGIFSYA